MKQVVQNLAAERFVFKRFTSVTKRINNPILMKYTIWFLIVSMFTIACSIVDKTLTVTTLKCEDLYNPLGIDKTVPRFSWQVERERNGTEQTAYQILVASNVKMLQENKADLWDSGKVGSGESLWISYNGTKLESGSYACWKVRVWDESGESSDWSHPAEFGIGLLNENDWKADYIAFNTDAGYRECPQLATSFDSNESDAKLLLHVNSLGYHEVYLNGSKVGEGVLTPAVSQFDKRSLINTYDVSYLIKKGTNDLLIWLGSGWYTEGLPGVVNNGPVVKAQLEKVENNRREIILTTDSGWKGRKSSYNRHGNYRPHRFGGEIVDGSLVPTDLVVNTSESGWHPVSLIDIPSHEVTPQMVELNRIQDTLYPSGIIKVAEDTFLVDMGKNLAGWIEVEFNGLKKSQEISMAYCDHLTEKGKFNDRNQYDIYIASGNDPEVFKNKFNYHGFRYIRITGLKEIPDLNSIKAHLVHTDYELASGFECSDPDMNAIHDMLFYTLRCLSIGGDLVDCPQIERLGYGGDGNASTLTAQIMFNLGPLYNNWLQAWADVIREDGSMPHTAPNPYNAGGGPYWCGFIITATWQTYLSYGDPLLLKKYYPVMQKWLEYVNKYSVDGLLKPWPNTDYRNWYLGDWATPEGIDQTAEASVDVVNNSFIAVCYDNMQKIARVLGKSSDADLYTLKKEELQNKIHEVYFNETNSSYGTGTQIDLAFPMIAGVVPENSIEKVTESFYNETEIKRNGHLACGLVGLPVITEWAVDNQEVELMYSMLKKRDYPGYLYMLDNGATTTWEHWDGARSHIHNCYNGIGSWFYQAIGGIRPVEDVPSYRKVRIEPQIPQGITWAKTFQKTALGKLALHWEIKDSKMKLLLEIPIGVEAEVMCPEGIHEYLLDGKTHLLQPEQNNGIILKGGKYCVEFEMTNS
ncbi:family 78 glycoside hydrolase catalytic domain [Prolixibacteraceae bacterium Z1-6]|uniref:alpha-L-rhamnosidase n=1 Tax=Draconibacterium aestuarii TaxID=2998507 RepID=A0A9X3F662_9BACT|nr:family 78 glycoside hydrolase catalytic domain [Prolixibacteraceae bacterium Z1-6]